MNSSPPARRRTLTGIVVTTAAVVAGSLTPLLADSAAAALPPAPSVVAPSVDGAPVKDVVLDWAPVTGAETYTVQVGTDGEWSDDPTLELTTVASRLTLPTSLPHASHVWRVAAVGAGGQGRWSSSGAFTRGWSERARPVSPIGTSTAHGLSVFRWTPVPTASEYQLQVSNSRYFDAAFRTQADAVTESCFTTRTSVTPFNSQDEGGKNDKAGDCSFSLLQTGEPRWWRVRPLDHVVDDAKEVDTSPLVDEGISSQPPASTGDLDLSACPEPPAPPASGAPIGGGQASPSPSSSPSASASPGSSPAASPSGSASPGSSPSASPTAAPATKGGCEPAHTVEKGAWSDGVAFTDVPVRAVAPVPAYDSLVGPSGPMPTPTRSSDVCVGAVCRDFPTISWSPVAGASAYRLYVALDAKFTNIHAVIETPGLSWTPLDAWRESTAGASYYVVVQPCTTQPTADGRRAGCDEPSAPVVFRKSSARLAQASPAAGALVGGSEVTLSWQSASSAQSAAIGGPATSEAYAYHVQVTTPDNPDFSTAGLVDDALVDTTHHVSSTKRYPDGTYLWRVQPVDASGHKLPWSSARTFTRDGTAPRFSVTASALGADGRLLVRFSEPVLGIGPRSVVLGGTSSTVTSSADRRAAVVRASRRLLPGAPHSLTVTSAITDRAGNPVAASKTSLRVDPLVDDRSASMAVSGRWTRLLASNAVSRTFSRSIPTVSGPTSASVVLFGRGAEVKGCVGPANGILEVWADGVRVKRVDSYRSYSGCGVVLTRASFPSGTGVHRIVVKGVGAKGPRSKGTAVAVDAVTALR